MTTSPAKAVEPKTHPRINAAITLTPAPVRRRDLWLTDRPALTLAAPVRDSTPAPSAQSIAPVTTRTPWWRPIVWLIGLPFRAIIRAWQQQGERRSLNGFSEHMLRDIGLSRAEIADAVRNGHPHPDRPYED